MHFNQAFAQGWPRTGALEHTLQGWIKRCERRKQFLFFAGANVCAGYTGFWETGFPRDGRSKGQGIVSHYLYLLILHFPCPQANVGCYIRYHEHHPYVSDKGSKTLPAIRSGKSIIPVGGSRSSRFILPRKADLARFAAQTFFPSMNIAECFKRVSGSSEASFLRCILLVFSVWHLICY